MKLFLIFLVLISCGRRPYQSAQLIEAEFQRADVPLRQSGPAPELASWPGTLKRGVLLKGSVSDPVFRTTVEHTPAGFRKIPRTGMIPLRHLILSGCSFTYGEGVDAGETFAALLSSWLPFTHVVNTGKRGAHPGDHVTLWSRVNMNELVPEEEGTFIYTIYEEQLERLLLAWHYLSWAHPDSEVYELTDRGPSVKGKLRNHPRFRVSRALSSLGLQELWLRFHPPVSLNYDTEDLKLFAETIVALKTEYLRAFPRGRFVVSWMGHRPLFRGLKDSIQVVTLLRARGVEVKFPPSPRISVDFPMHLPRDGHPSAFAHQAYADFLYTQLLRGEFPENSR